MKQRVRKLSIRAKFIISVMGILMIVLALVGGSSIMAVQSNLIALGGEQAEIAAKLAMSDIDTDQLLKLKPGDEDGDAYNAIVEPMRDVQKLCGVKYLYTLTTDGAKVYYGIDTDKTSGRCAIGEEFSETYTDLKTVFDGSGYVSDTIEPEGEDVLITAYLPIKDAEGNTVAVLGCDYDASSVQTRINNLMVSVAVLSAIGYVFAFIIIYFVAGMITKGMKRVNSKLYELVHNEGDLTQKIAVKSGDEMEIMADNLNELLDYIRQIMLQISSNASSLHTSCTSIAENLQTSYEGVSDVSSTMEEMSAAVEETSVSFEQIHDSIGDVYEKIRNVSNKALEGDELTQEIQVRAKEIYEVASVVQKEAGEKASVMSETVNEKI